MVELKIVKTNVETEKNKKEIKSVINYNLIETFLGKMFIASTNKGVCYLVFETDFEKNINYLKKKFPQSELMKKEDQFQGFVKKYLNNQNSQVEAIFLHLIGTEFQLKVWESLLKIPPSETTFYGKIAEEINNRKAVRAVGTAIGNNPIAFIVPCHRVLQKTGKIGGYKWGVDKKIQILNLEKNIK